MSINFPGTSADTNAPVWNMLADGGIDLDLVNVDPAGTWDLVSGDKRVSFGEATTETGDAATGWDYTTYELIDGEWEITTQDYTGTDEVLLDILRSA